MTREELSHYHDYEVRLHVLQTEVVGDTAKDYSTGFPRSIMLCGLAQDDKTLSEVKLLREKLNALDAYIDGIADVRAKTLVEAKYKYGKSWQSISKITGRDCETERQYLSRFFKKNM